MQINLPEGAVLCDMNLSSEANQDMFYDDHFLLTLNDVVFATTYDNFIPMLDSIGENNLPLYDWENIVANSWQVQDETDFCLGDSSVCSWPMSETQGSMTVSLGNRTVEEVMALDIQRNEHELQFVTTGDNNSTDCIHSEFKFDADIKYAVPTVIVP